ncbi:uncharacterized protein LOC120410223 [Corvus cornix cornix]|uniref:uncharacterized protein LOC120410223 n=1 Tax=Corvus cornix cornix TaxID=932674 RepID=UPI0019528C7E|nr:uncharacterized protein LOC120410223 [Corvus cornix cornix]
MQAPDIFNFLKVRGGSWFNPLGSGPAALPQPRQHRAFASRRLRRTFSAAGAPAPRKTGTESGHRDTRDLGTGAGAWGPASTVRHGRRLQERQRRERRGEAAAMPGVQTSSSGMEGTARFDGIDDDPRAGASPWSLPPGRTGTGRTGLGALQKCRRLRLSALGARSWHRAGDWWRLPTIPGASGHIHPNRTSFPSAAASRASPESPLAVCDFWGT